MFKLAVIPIMSNSVPGLPLSLGRIWLRPGPLAWLWIGRSTSRDATRKNAAHSLDEIAFWMAAMDGRQFNYEMLLSIQLPPWPNVGSLRSALRETVTRGWSLPQAAS